MMKPRILINIHYMELGGAERALLGLLYAIDTNKVDVDLFVNQHTCHSCLLSQRTDLC